MAKIGGPLFSHTASGLIGERLVFSRRASGQQARFQKAQKDVITDSRTAQRTKYTNSVNAWNALSQAEQDVYIDRAKNKRYTGYNLFLSEFIIIPPTTIYGVAIYGIDKYGQN